MKSSRYSVFLLLCLALPARAANVYSGCADPASGSNKVWYFDPVNGKTKEAGGNGSQSAPWNNLQALVQAETGYSYPLLTTAPYRQVPVAGQPAVVKTGPDAGPIAPGDEILLMSGNYGNILIGGLAAEISNSDFVTVEAAPGQTPVLTSLFVGETNMWVFNGLKVQSLQSAAFSGNALVTIKDGGASLPTSDIVLENMIISSQDNAEAWTQAQWVANAREGFYAISSAGGVNTECVSLTGSHISNIRTGALLFANKLVFSNNQLDHFGDDGIDYAASNLAITKNNIHDNLNIGDGNHPDAMQGQIGILATGATVNYFQNILIDSNLIVRQIDPELSFPYVLQGIDAFDSDWTNVTVTNNVVVTHACWGIDFSSIHNSLIANNTVVDDGGDGGQISAPGCTAAVSIGTTTHESSLSSSNTALRNNLASRLIIDNLAGSGVEADHNVIMAGSVEPLIAWYVNGVIQYLGSGSPGLQANYNIIDTGGANSEFVNFSPATMTYTLLLKTGADAIGTGISNGASFAGVAAVAPTLDILGATRTYPTTTAGAYSYPY
jgi:hypothetical protein